MHPDSFPGQPHKIKHRRPDKMSAARRGIYSCADTGTNNSSTAIHEVAVNAGSMVAIFLQDRKFASRRHPSAFTGGDRGINRQIVSRVNVGALPAQRDDYRGISRIKVRKNILLNNWRYLAADQLLRRRQLRTPVDTYCRPDC